MTNEQIRADFEKWAVEQDGENKYTLALAEQAWQAAHARYAGSESEAAISPLTLPTDGAREVFRKTLESNPDADMRAIPNQWLLDERGKLSTVIRDLESRPPAQPKVPEGLSREELGIIRQWYNAVRDCHPTYLNSGGISDEAVIKKVQFLLSAQENTRPAPAVPEGYALVPIEPTEQMIAAGFGYDAEENSTYRLHPAQAYKAMLTQATKENNNVAR